MLEIDHLVTLARGGRDDLSNLSLVCREHNHHRARQILGAETIDRYRPLGQISRCRLELRHNTTDGEGVAIAAVKDGGTRIEP
jgi:hypothetical protein